MRILVQPQAYPTIFLCCLEQDAGSLLNQGYLEKNNSTYGPLGEGLDACLVGDTKANGVTKEDWVGLMDKDDYILDRKLHRTLLS